MSHDVAIIGAGMGGLSASIMLARAGRRVLLLEARDGSGGLASGLERDGFRFDAGPYILLDRPGLDWAFNALGLDLEATIPLTRVEHPYEVMSGDGSLISFHADLAETASGFDRLWPGSGRRYERFIAETCAAHRALAPLLRLSSPGLLDLIRHGALPKLPFLLRSLGSILRRSALPVPLAEAIGIWTHIAGQRMDEAPGPMAFVPALIHTVGACYPGEGIASIPRALERAAVDAGVEIRYGAKVRGIVAERGRAAGVELESGEMIPSGAVLSNHSGIGTYLNMMRSTPEPERRRLASWPLQSPGACAYLAVRGEPGRSYLRFKLPEGGGSCRLLLTPAAVLPGLMRDGWSPARLIAPMPHAMAERAGEEGQRDYLAGLLGEEWWREGVSDVRVLATRVPAEWGRDYNLYRESMNPVMTARLMRSGRIAHRSRHLRGLYLAGSSTHPGQWVSFTAISGVLAAGDLLRDGL